MLPVERGKGMEQAGMRAAESRLAAGDWVHIFPEGTRSPDGRSVAPQGTFPQLPPSILALRMSEPSVRRAVEPLCCPPSNSFVCGSWM